MTRSPPTPPVITPVLTENATTAVAELAEVALFQKALALHQQGQWSQAQSLYEHILAENPAHFDAMHLLGVVELQCGNPQIALVWIDEALQINPRSAAAHSNRGVALKDLQRWEEALASYERAIAIKPDYAEAIENKAHAVKALKNQHVTPAVNKALASKLFAQGNELLKHHQLTQAVASYDQAIAICPEDANTWNNRGIALKGLMRLDEAVLSYDQALAINPQFAQSYNNRGNALKALDRLGAALESYEQAMRLKPDYDFLMGMKLQTQMQLCKWQDLAIHTQALRLAIAAGQKVTLPFPVLSLIDDTPLQRQAAATFVNAHLPKSELSSPFKIKSATEKIRIGYYSADFHNHATAHLMAELLESHDPDLFEIYGFSFGPDRQDAMRLRLTQGFDHFTDIRTHSDRDVAQLSRDLGIDIAVDLKGFTADARTGIFAHRCAPIQVNYLGYPGTMASPFMDYIVADKTLIPPHSQAHYSEKVVYLPHSYQVNDSKRPISDKVFTRMDAGLPEQGFVFCCFNNNYKIQPESFDLWMRLLKGVEGSVLWLFEDNPSAAQNLRQQAQTRGVDPSRLAFAARMELSEHLARHRLADLFLDTLPYNAHTTASDALWAGLPVLTLIGQSFAARVAASLLHAMDLPELVTHSASAYEAKALALATQPEMLQQIKSKIERNRKTSPLFQGQLFAKHLETAFVAMFERHQSGLAPDHILVAA